MVDKVEQTDKVVDLKPAAAEDSPTRRKGIYLLPNIWVLFGKVFDRFGCPSI